jgi:hypothetical protein
MSQRFAILDQENKTVMSVFQWDGISTWITPQGMQALMIPQNSPVQVGWRYLPETNSFLKTVDSPSENVRKLAKIDFMRLFTTDEMVRYKLLRMQINALTAADYAAAMAGDAVKMMMIQADVFFDRFDLASEVEMDHPETVQAVELLASTGIFGADATPEHIAERIDQVLAGLQPTPVPVPDESGGGE